MVDVEAEKRGIQTATKSIKAAENRKDIHAALEFMIEDYISLECHAPHIQERDAWAEDYEEFCTSFASTSITPLRIEDSSSGDMAWEHGEYARRFRECSGGIRSGQPGK
jgi:ketosteroid isomerase-like protein